jgi:hypothetical protein
MVVSRYRRGVMAHLNTYMCSPLPREIARRPPTTRKNIVLAPVITKEDDLNCLELSLIPGLGAVKVTYSLTRF